MAKEWKSSGSALQPFRKSLMAPLPGEDVQLALALTHVAHVLYATNRSVAQGLGCICYSVRVIPRLLCRVAMLLGHLL